MRPDSLNNSDLIFTSLKFADNPTTLPLFEIEPRRNQLVFTGDRTRLSCEGTDLIQSQVSLLELREFLFVRSENK